jgi:hypothetical protein
MLAYKYFLQPSRAVYCCLFIVKMKVTKRCVLFNKNYSAEVYIPTYIYFSWWTYRISLLLETTMKDWFWIFIPLEILANISLQLPNIQSQSFVLYLSLLSNAYTFWIWKQSLFLYLLLVQQEERAVNLQVCIFRQNSKK